MDKLRDNTYINIQSWMVTELGLKNNELIIYAIIYGFCQDGQSRFRGRRSYLAKWTNSTTRGVQKNLNSMIEKGLIAKEERIVNGVKACEYYPVNLPWENASSEADAREEEQASADEDIGREQSSPNNIKSNIKDNITDKSSSSSRTDTVPGTDTSIVSPVRKSPGEVSEMVAQVVERWNRLEEIGITPVSRISRDSARYHMLRARLREYGLEAVLLAVDNIARSKFLRGESRTGWSIKFDWFVRPNNFPKVLEGNYIDDDKNVMDRAGKGGSGYADAGRESGGYPSGGSGESGQSSGGAKGYDPRDFLGHLLDD